MKFGANVERIQGNTFGADFPGGQLIFNGNSTNDTGLSDFLTNRSADINADVPGTVTGRGVRQTIFGTYFQDDMHVRPNLSVNWGLRYEMASIITEEAGKLANLRVLLPNVTPGTPAYPNHTGSPYIMNPTKRNFEPRVGFAWDPFKNGKTSVAGGFGIFDVLPLPVEMGSGVDGSFPFDITYSATGLAGPLRHPIVLVPIVRLFPRRSLCQALTAQSNRFYVMQFDPKRNYVMQWNLNIQREIAPEHHTDRRLCWCAGPAHEISGGRREHGLPDIDASGLGMASSEYGPLLRWRSIHMSHGPSSTRQWAAHRWPYLTESTITMGFRSKLKRLWRMASRWKVPIPIPRTLTTAAVRSLRIRSGIQSPRCYGFAKRAGGVSLTRTSGTTSRRITYGTSPLRCLSDLPLRRFSAIGRQGGF